MKITLIFTFFLCSVSIFAQSITDVAKQFLGKPYEAGTLELPEEQLVVLTDRFDCVTLAETVVALWQADGDTTKLAQNLQNLRYRNGILIDYNSRLHYFSEWILDNEVRGNLHDITQKFGGIITTRPINYISQNTQKFPQINQDSIRLVEQRINDSKRFVIPKSLVKSIENQIPEGAIIAFENRTDGLDFAHVGIAIKVGDETHLLHASSSSKMVCISELPLHKYLEGIQHFGGIVVVIPIKKQN